MDQNSVAEIGEDSPLALQILDYLRRHPQAKDSVEGIARWWVNADPLDVRRALDKLVELNLVEKNTKSAMELYSAGPESRL